MGRYHAPASLDRSLDASPSYQTASNNRSKRPRRTSPNGTTQSAGQTVRFELPFATWCTTCQPEAIIGQGVRFNAQKTKVGNYYSTPIWQFAIKHTLCGGLLEIRTDPQAGEYVVVSGGRRRDYGAPKEEEWGVISGVGKASEQEKERLEKEGGFALLEKVEGEKREKETSQRRVKELWADSERRWGDPYERSRALRREFRIGRRQRQDDKRTGGILAERYGLGMEVLPLETQDASAAGEVEFGGPEEAGRPAVKPLFVVHDTKANINGNGAKMRQRGEPDENAPKAHQKTKLQGLLKGNTRAHHSPFLNVDSGASWEPRTKRRKADEDTGCDELQTLDQEQHEAARQSDVSTNDQAPAVSTGLVAYDSD